MILIFIFLTIIDANVRLHCCVNCTHCTIYVKLIHCFHSVPNTTAIDQPKKSFFRAWRKTIRQVFSSFKTIESNVSVWLQLLQSWCWKLSVFGRVIGKFSLINLNFRKWIHWWRDVSRCQRKKIFSEIQNFSNCQQKQSVF